MVGVAAIAAALLALPAANAASGPLSASFASGPPFPVRTLVLSAPAGIHVSVPQMYIWENGHPVNNLTVTPVRQANPGDFGVVLVIDQSQSMAGAPIAHAMAAARALAARRTGNQELGVITFGSRATTLLPLTSDRQAISKALSTTPSTRTGTQILPALTAAINQLKAANIADGAVILLSDGAATPSAGNLTPQSVGAAAQAQHVRIFTVGLTDRSSDPSLMRRLAQYGGGQFVPATGAQLPQAFTSIASGLTSSYLIRYRSTLSSGQHVAVKIDVKGAAAPARLSYYARTASATSSGTTPSGTKASGTTPSSSPSSSKASRPSRRGSRLKARRHRRRRRARKPRPDRGSRHCRALRLRCRDGRRRRRLRLARSGAPRSPAWRSRAAARS